MTLCRLWSAALAATLTMTTVANAREYEVTVRNDIVFAEHDGTKLLGDLYLPKGLDKAPVLVAVHGGGWQIGDRKFYQNWGTYLAKNGFAVFAIEYRLMKPGVKTWPGAVYDTKAAVQYVRAQAAELGEDPLFSGEYRGDPHAAISAKVKAVVAFYGVYDMVGQWEHDQLSRPRDNISEKFLGGSPMVNRKVYFDASPISYATVDKNTTRFLLLYGHEDDIVDPKSQSERFLLSLKQAQFLARTIVVPGAGHFWSVDPVDEGFGAYAGPKVLRFLESFL